MTSTGLFQECSYRVSEPPDGPADAPWAVNVHGFLADGQSLWAESDDLANRLGWRVLTPHLPGLGRGEAFRRRLDSVHAVSDRLGALVDHLGLDRAVLLGHSMGASVVVALAAARPELASGIVYRNGCATPAWRNFASPLTASYVELVEAAPRHPLFEVWRSSIDMLEFWSCPGAWDWIASVRTLDLTTAIESLRAASVPMLCMWGRRDLVAPAQGAEEFCRASGAALIWVRGGHFWMSQDPTAQARSLRRGAGRGFLQALRPEADPQLIS
jgi:pimeloyl-ACP methyl ester carboxylesterase